MRDSRLESGGRYPVLRAIAILWMVGAVIVAIYGLYQAIVTLAGIQRLEAVSTAPNWAAQIMGFLVWLASTFFAVIVSLAVAEGIKLFMDLEQSCRAMATGTFTSNAAAMAPPRTTGVGERIGGRLSETAEGELMKGG